MPATGLAYVKCGDVAGEARRYFAEGSRAQTSSPDAFTHAVLDVGAGRPLLLAGAHGRPQGWSREAMQLVDFGARFARQPASLVRDMAVLVQTLRRFRPAEVVCGAPGPMFWASFVATRMVAAKLVYCQHVRLNEAGARPGRRLRKWLDRVLIRRADAVLAHGPYLEAQLREAGVPAERILRFELAFGSDPGEIAGRGAQRGRYILFVGRMERLKGVFDLIDACEPLLQHDPSLHLKLAGTGSAEQAVSARICASPAAGRIDLLGAVPHPRVAALMRNAQAVVTPTRRAFPEGRCMAALEALVYGTPVIAPAFGPFPYLVEDHANGLLYEPDSVPALRSAIAELLGDERLRAALRRGAVAAGARLREPELTFRDALQRVLRPASPAARGLRQGVAR